MDQVFQPPAVTLFDAVTSTIAAVSYLAVGLAAIARAPRDERARVFLAVALTSAVAYAGPGLQYWKGIPIISRPVVVPTLVATAIGGVALFHFAFVFPWRRPWLRRHREWVMAAYLVAPMGVLWLAWLAPPSLDAIAVNPDRPSFVHRVAIEHARRFQQDDGRVRLGLLRRARAGRRLGKQRGLQDPQRCNRTHK